MYPSSAQNAIQIRKALLSKDPAVQAQAARALGYKDPHIELVAIESALRSDLDAPRLTPQVVKYLTNAATSHVALLPIEFPHAQADIIAKAKGVVLALLNWASRHGHHDALEDHIDTLCFDLQGVHQADLTTWQERVAA